MVVPFPMMPDGRGITRDPGPVRVSRPARDGPCPRY